MQKRVVSAFVLAVISPTVRADHLDRFALPLFNKQGEKICDIFGTKAVIIDNNRFQITDIAINSKINSDDPISIISDQADVDPQKNQASGNGFIAISNPFFSATGNDWKLLGNEKLFTLNQNVQVFFEKN